MVVLLLVMLEAGLLVYRCNNADRLPLRSRYRPALLLVLALMLLPTLILSCVVLILLVPPMVVVLRVVLVLLVRLCLIRRLQLLLQLLLMPVLLLLLGMWPPHQRSALARCIIRQLAKHTLRPHLEMAAGLWQKGREYHLHQHRPPKAGLA